MTTMMAQMRRAMSDEGANVTLARSLLAHVSSRLSASGGADLHRRCVVFDCAPPRARVEDVCAALAPAGAIEAVVLCEYMCAAVVVFRSPAGAESALRGPARTSCHQVPPLDLGAELRVIRPTDVKIMSDSRIPAVAGAAWTPPPEGDAWTEHRNPSASAEANGPVLPPPRGIKRFRPISEPLVGGPTPGGADGGLWMHGDMIGTDKHGVPTECTDSMRVRRTDDPPPDKRRAGVEATTVWFQTF